MNTHLEIEFKQLLSKEIYEAIKKQYFQKVNTMTQTNHYLTDNKGILSSLRYSLRVRELNNTYEFTLKVPQGFSKLEFNEMITKEDYHKLLNQEHFTSIIFDELDKVNVTINDLKLLTSLTTHRLEREYQNGILCIDESHYGNTVDYEMEYEAENEENGKQIFTQLLSQYNLEYQGNCPGKYTRALQLL